MIKRLNIVDGRSRKSKPCAQLSYNTETGEYLIRIADDATADDVPMMMEPFVERDQLDMGPEWSRRWVEERLVPSSRQNIGEILRAHDLEEYDAFALLEASGGVSSQDYFVVRLPDAGLPESREAMRRSVASGLADLRKQSGLLQHELAGLAGVNQAVVSRSETGKSNLTLGLLHDLAYAMGYEVEVSFRRR